MPWYSRPDAARYSRERRCRRGPRAGSPFRLPVQWVNRPNLDFRGYAGTLASGASRRGDDVVVAGSGTHHRRSTA